MEKCPTLLVLAAGMGSRYGGLKQMDAFGPNGETIIDYSIYDAIEAGFCKVVFIVRDSFMSQFKEVYIDKYADKVALNFVAQELDDLPIEFSVPDSRAKPWGTGHAVWVARNVIDGPFAVINGDDYYGKNAFKDMVKFFQSDKDNYAVMGYYLKNTLSDHGTVNRGVCYADKDGNLTKVVECTKISRDKNGVISYPHGKDMATLDEETLVSMNLWGFRANYFDIAGKILSDFIKEKGNEEKSELYIPAVIDHMIAENILDVKLLTTDSDWFGVTYQEDKPVVMEKIRMLIKEGIYPVSLW
jgi:dTDP-glucose pyrophosphorylase